MEHDAVRSQSLRVACTKDVSARSTPPSRHRRASESTITNSHTPSSGTTRPRWPVKRKFALSECGGSPEPAGCLFMPTGAGPSGAPLDRSSASVLAKMVASTLAAVSIARLPSSHNTSFRSARLGAERRLRLHKTAFVQQRQEGRQLAALLSNPPPDVRPSPTLPSRARAPRADPGTARRTPAPWRARAFVVCRPRGGRGACAKAWTRSRPATAALTTASVPLSSPPRRRGGVLVSYWHGRRRRGGVVGERRRQNGRRRADKAKAWTTNARRARRAWSGVDLCERLHRATAAG